MNSEMKKIIVEEVYAAISERNTASERAEFELSVIDRLADMRKDNPEEFKKTFNKAMTWWDENRLNSSGEEQLADTPGVIDDKRRLDDKVSWVVKNVLIPAKFDKIFDKLINKYAKEEAGLSGTMPIKQFTDRLKDALKKINKEFSDLMSGMVTENKINKASPEVLEIIVKIYEMYNRK